MQTAYFFIGGIPAVLYGAPAGRAYLFLHGQMGRKEEGEAFAQVVDVVNRTPSGAWGYAPLGDAIRFAYENQLMAHKQLSLQLSLTARRDASEEEVEEAFHRLLNGVEIQVELTYADGSVGSTRLAFSVSDPVGEGLSATLITRAAP